MAEIRERIKKFIEDITPILKKAEISAGELLPLISFAENGIESSENCYAFGITYDLVGLGEGEGRLRRLFDEAHREGRIITADWLKAGWIIADFVSEVKGKIVENLEKCKLGSKKL